MEWFERVKTYLSFSKDELLNMLLATIIIGFVFSFRNFSNINLFLAILTVALSILFHVTAQKIAALRIGFKTVFKISWYGLLISLMLIFVTNGRTWWLVLPGGVTFSILAGLRLGRMRYGLNYGTMGSIGLVGPAASLLLATIFKQVDIWFFANSSTVLHNIFIFNLAYAVCEMLPIPPLDGHYMFYASRLWYVFLFVIILVYSLLAAYFNLYSWIFAIIAGALGWLIYYLTVERKLG